MAVHDLNGHRRGSAAPSTSSRRYIDVEVRNVETRLSPVFEYLLSLYTGADDELHGAAKGTQKTEVEALLSTAVQDSLKAARGGFLDAQTLLLDALFFAWVKDMTIAIQCDPFLARSKWRLSTRMFVSLVKDAGLECHLKRKLHSVPEHAFQHLTTELLPHER